MSAILSLPPPTLLARPQNITAPIRGAWQSAATRPPKGEVRFTCPLTGIRFYAVPDGKGSHLAVPGVTSIQSAAAPPEEKQRLADWRKREIAAGRDPDKGRNRGSAVHALLENAVRGDRHLHMIGEGEHTELTAWASGMEKHLRPYESFLWNERPLIRGWDHCWSTPDAKGKRLARVWSLRWGFAGTPDLIGVRRWGKDKSPLNILADFKTSNCPYFRSPGTPVPQHQRLGYLKYCKTVEQLGAYKLAIEETLGLEIHRAQIIVGLKEAGKAQMFHISAEELAAGAERFKRKAVAFWARQHSIADELIAA
jgi:hypothetical protein